MQLIDGLINLTFYGGLSYIGVGAVLYAAEWTDRRVALKHAAENAEVVGAQELGVDLEKMMEMKKAQAEAEAEVLRTDSPAEVEVLRADSPAEVEVPRSDSLAEVEARKADSETEVEVLKTDS